MTKVHALTIVASVFLHAALTAALSWVALRTLANDSSPVLASTQEPDSSPIVLELPFSEGFQLDEEPVDATGEPPRAPGGDPVAHLDVAAPGHGGDATAQTPALNLADDDERMRLSPDLLSRLDRDQLQRVRVSRFRASWEDRRSTTHPAELTLVAMGLGTVRERRTVSASEPNRGTLGSPRPSVRGAELGAAAPFDLEGDRRPGGERIGSREGAPGLGLYEARAGVDHRASAPVGSVRPAVTRGPVAVPASDRALPTDDFESEQEVATTVRSLVHASTAGGARGDGQGGSGGGGESGFGASSGVGSRARVLGLGEGDVYDYWTSDPRLLPYFRQIHAKIDPLWADAFPKSALLELKQGTVIIEFTVFADGRAAVAWPPLRPSGIDEFDRNCADAIRRAGPFPRIPIELGVRSLRIRAPFVANNPVVK